ncbi:MAG: hypothetical protein ABI440_11065 [Casimicrobiaceae bacterium]
MQRMVVQKCDAFSPRASLFVCRTVQPKSKIAVLYSCDKRSISKRVSRQRGKDKESFMIRIRTLLCAASAACGVALAFTATAATLTLDIPACNTVSLNGNTIVCGTSGGSGPTPSCSLSPTNPSVAIGSSTTITASCSNFPGPFTYSWTGCTSGGSGNTCTISSSQVGTIPVSVTAQDSVPNSVSKGTTVTFYDPNAGTGGGGTAIPTTCASDGSKTIVGKTIQVFNNQYSLPNLSNKSTAIFPVVIPASGKMLFQFYQNGDGTDATVRTAYIAKTPCDFTYHPSNGSYPQQQFGFYTSTGNLIGVVDGGSNVTQGATGVTLHGAPGETWYLMFQNKTDRGKDSCFGTCSIFVNASLS